MYQIKNCRSCNSKKLSKIISIGKQYLSDFRSDKRKPKKFPLDLIVCKDCRLVQLRHNAPSSLLYSERYGYKSGINQTMKKELKEIVEKSIDSVGKKGNLTVVDIGANDGTLISFYPKKYFKVAVEPIKKLAKEAKTFSNKVVNDFFNHESFIKTVGKNKKADIITAISCFYDMEDPNKFVADVKKIMVDDGIFVIQQNYLLEMLNQNAFDNIVHEHLEYYSLLSLENLLDKFDLEVFDLELSNINGGSFRTYICKKGVKPVTNAVKNQRALEKKYKLETMEVYKDFSNRVKNNAKNLYKFIKEKTKEGKTFYLYGASTRGNTLLQYFKLDSKLIKAAVERNPEKWGKYISSVTIPIISEEQARKDKPDYMVVLPWFFKEEFLQRENKYLESGGHLIFPLPKFEII